MCDYNILIVNLFVQYSENISSVKVNYAITREEGIWNNDNGILLYRRCLWSFDGREQKYVTLLHIASIFISY